MKNIKIYKKIIGFTLIELLVWVSISIMLMLSVSIFVSSGMKNIMDENKVLENSLDFNEFSSAMQESLNLTWSWNTIKRISSTGVLFKRNQYFDKWGFTYIWEKEKDKFYCMSGSESTSTNHLIMKTFVPFEEQGENMFSASVWSYDKIFTASVTWWWNTYTSYALDHVVKMGTQVLIWKEIYWDKFTNWAFGTWVYLNNPTGLALSWTNILFVSDTLNDRVLYYNTITKKIYTLLDEYDWLSEPTGLYYDNINNKLYISNSWKWEILEYSSPVINTAPTLTMTGFSKVIDKIDLSFSWQNLPNLINNWTWTITNNTSNPNYLTWTSDNLKYYFVSPNSESIQFWCAWNETQFFNWKPSVYCTKTWSWKVANYPVSTVSKIKISNLSWLSNTWTYYVDLKLYNWTTLKYQKYYSYFTQWDWDILTPGDNTLKVIRSNLKYPTGVWGSWINQYNEFLDWTYDFWNTSYNDQADYILKTPLKSLSVDYDIPNKFLTILIKYYKNYNCYNLDDNAQRSYIMKKKF